MSNRNLDSNGRRIAKNVFFLYIRMVVSMIISLYTSRVILNVLGIEDYGIYTIVGGVVILFTFISSSMNAATQRYLNVAMGKNEEGYVEKVFSNSLGVYMLLCLLILCITEIVGLWFLENKLNIPYSRISAAKFVFHISVLTFGINFLRTPYNAVVIANERMSFYAYSSLVESGLKLVIVWILSLFVYDKLKLYAILVLLVAILILIWYYCYIRMHFHSYRYSKRFDRKLIKEMMSFSGWNLLGGIADVGMSQGTNMILNIFYGVSLNAALGLTNQVKSVIFSFIANLQLAANPQIVKSYTRGDTVYFRKLFFSISKYSFYLILLVALPLLFNVDYVLNLWLVNPPPYMSNFLILVVVLLMLDSFHGPLWTTMQANGNLKQYQIVISSLLLLNIPLIYITLKMGFHPDSIIIVQIVINIIVLIVRLLYAKIRCGISIYQYIANVLRPVLVVSVAVIPLISCIAHNLANGLLKLVLVVLATIVIVVSSVYILGINRQERFLVKREFKKYLNKWKERKF